jgi:hypothetical protein
MQSIVCARKIVLDEYIEKRDRIVPEKKLEEE